MPVTLTSPAVGKQPGDTHTGPEEAWLLAEGYAEQAGYTGPGVSNTGPAAADPDNDLTLAANREDPTDADYDVDLGSVDDEGPTLTAIDPATGPAAGGETVTITGDDLTGTTGVTFGGVAATGVTVVDDNTVTAVTPAGVAGAVDVVVTDNVGSDTLTGGYTYE